ncbi:ADP-ribosylation [Gymnopus androsaceus JB14]|uniref:ADP-ribosylation n=1 Tax=Gymnopus androsaceus JB14 TaxID=1447944 RepID=A0A6A4HRF0_9AGAR|nr:ADP-ribosylation [Gymnopus androsaceus JB14]
MAIDEYSLNHPDNHHRKRYARILPLESSDPKFAQVEKLFLKGWCHPNKPKQDIRAVFKVLSSDESLELYTNYKSQVQAFNLLSRFKKGANEQLYFHGTRRSCALGQDSNKVLLCNSPECVLCSIIRGSFDVGKCGKSLQRSSIFDSFGTGIYTTACSSKADDYYSVGQSRQQYAGSKTASRNSRVLLLNRVVVGRPHNRRHNATHMNQPPSGHHSVVGLPGVDLNYEETVVYRNDAIRPAYLVVYEPRLEQKKQGLFPNSHDSQKSVRSYSKVFSALFKTPLAV